MIESFVRSTSGTSGGDCDRKYHSKYVAAPKAVRLSAGLIAKVGQGAMAAAPFHFLKTSFGREKTWLGE